jgi:hypothetical protein
MPSLEDWSRPLVWTTVGFSAGGDVLMATTATFSDLDVASMEASFAGVPTMLSDVGDYLVPNPLGDPLKVNWKSLGARYWKQINQIELTKL